MRSIRYYFGVLAINNVCKNYNQRNFDDINKVIDICILFVESEHFFHIFYLTLSSLRKGWVKITCLFFITHLSLVFYDFYAQL